MDRVINFMGARRICFALSAALILLGIGLMAFRGLNLGIDFQGGVHLVVKFSESVSAEAVRSALAEAGFSSAKVVTAPGNEFLIDTTVEEAGTGQRIVQLLGERFPLEDFSITEVGANVGQDLQRRGVIMIVLSLGLLLLYISLRFHWRFAVGAVVALVHDVMITLGLFAAFGLEINLPTLAAFLTVVGYSVNDTIVVFDRIRENQRLLRDMPLVALVNTSITQMLTRTLLTSLTTLFVVLMILAVSGPGELRTFSLALTFGIIVGTYSSIYIASPIMMMLRPRAALLD